MREAQIASTREMADADREIKIIKVFAEKITSPDENEQKMAIRMLRAIDANLAERLATAVLEGEPEKSELRTIAEGIAEEAAAARSGTPRVYVHIQREEERVPARSIAEKLQAKGFLVPGIERLVNVGPKSSQLRFFRKVDEGEAGEIVEFLKSLGIDMMPVYIPGYEGSRSIRPRHYELWFAPSGP